MGCLKEKGKEGKGREWRGEEGRRAKGSKNGIKLGVELFGRIWRESEEKMGANIIFIVHIYIRFFNNKENCF